MGFFQKAYPAVKILPPLNRETDNFKSLLEKFEKMRYKENLSMGVGK
jgi:hypothetical protein